MQEFVEIGLSNDSKEEMIEVLKHKGFVLISGTFTFGQWLYSAMNDETLVDKDNTLETWFSYGTEINEVGEKFIDLRTKPHFRRLSSENHLGFCMECNAQATPCCEHH